MSTFVITNEIKILIFILVRAQKTTSQGDTDASEAND